MTERFVGLDLGAETIKAVELQRDGSGRLTWVRREIVEHRKEPASALLELVRRWEWPTVRAAAVSGRLCRRVALPFVPTKQAQAASARFLFGEQPATVVSIGSHGFTVLELRGEGVEVFRENSRCSQGTGNFLRQLVERFDMGIEEASALCAEIEDPAPLSGRCPVILKTDMTHLANNGESRARILAGLFDAVCENVQVLLKPRLSPPRVALIGGVSRSSRIRAHFRRFLGRHSMQLLPLEGDDGLFFEALGCALEAAAHPAQKHPPIESLFVELPEEQLEAIPALASYLGKVKRLPAPAAPSLEQPRPVILGFDIGSTGSKAVALDRASREVVWEGYLRTNGNPVGAAQSLMRQFVEGPARAFPVHAVGATGSGREIVGSLMATCYGPERVFVLNEIAAHAEGALSYDPRVDTIFEIGGQDAKYIRLAEGRVVDAAMNEACSAGTGSFIEEQGNKFSGVKDVAQLGREALAARGGVSLGQHCSVFMAEIIDEAVSAGVERGAIITGIYDSIIQNYLNRVKGSRTVGEVIFCQGMPFAADALAAAVARQTGAEVIVPPNPGTIGAVGIARLALKELAADAEALDPARFLGAQVEAKDTFVCKSTQGCGGAGNKCRIDRLTTVVDGARQRFTWGGGCSLYDKGTRKRKLPDRAPDPFRARDELLQRLVAELSPRRGGKVIALTDEFQLKGLFPFFATFLRELGFDLEITTGGGQAALKRGIEQANVPFCAPMQLYHGLVGEMAEGGADFLFMPMLREVNRVRDEAHSVLCPIVQASPEMLRWDLGKIGPKLITTLVDMGPGNLGSEKFAESCRRIAADLGLRDDRWRAALQAGLDAQERFDAACLQLGHQALLFCERHDLVPVVVLGRAYTIYNTVLNSNVPALLREQGAIAIPVDCYPVDAQVPIFEGMYWSYGQRNLRAAHQIRRTPGIYAVYCSNYSCGPDSFTLHFFSFLMEGRPFAVIETDGHSGDAGTKTRLEAFLHCVNEDRRARPDKPAADLQAIDTQRTDLGGFLSGKETLLIPYMGAGAEVLAAAMRGIGIDAQALPSADRETVRVGRRHTSGKECVPMTLTLGALLQRLERERDTDRRFGFLMPTAYGPCRFGVYNLLDKVVLERLGMRDRVRVFSPSFAGYYDSVPDGFAALAFVGFMGSDLLHEAFYDALPVEARPGAAKQLFRKYLTELCELLEAAGHGDLSGPSALLEVASGRLFGVTELLGRAAEAFAAIREARPLPTVLLVGEIFVRCDPFSNGFVAEALSARGIRVRTAPFTEWLEYADYINIKNGEKEGLLSHLSSFVRGVIQALTWSAMSERLGWPPRTTVREALGAAAPYLREEFQGEAVLTIGGPLHEWREGHIDGVVSAGPLECMPNKIAESQFFHLAEQEGLLSLTLALNGDPIPPDALDNFVYEVKARFAAKAPREKPAPRTLQPMRMLNGMGKLAARQAMQLASLAFPGATGFLGFEPADEQERRRARTGPGRANRPEA